jgi:hypothetical protein
MKKNPFKKFPRGARGGWTPFWYMGGWFGKAGWLAAPPPRGVPAAKQSSDAKSKENEKKLVQKAGAVKRWYGEKMRSAPK